MFIHNAISPYKIKHLNGGSVTPTDYLLNTLNINISNIVPMDGANLVTFENEQHLIFGWDPYDTPTVQKTHYKSSDGITWTQLADFPGTERHAAPCVVMGGKIWVYGGDFLTDVWTYDSINGWVQVTADWGLGDRGLVVYWTDDTYLYVAGGQNTLPSTNFYDEVYRSSNGITWTQIGTLPSADVCTGVGLKFGSDFYVFSGGQYIGAGVINWNTNIYKSSNGGVTWTTIASPLPNDMRAGYPSGCVWDSKIWYLMGTDTTGNNKHGLYSTTDLGTWTQLYDNPRARHADQLNVMNDKMYVVTGNLWNDSVVIEKVPVTTEIASGAIGVYGFQRIKTGYTGNLCRLRKASDNTEYDIGQDEFGNLDPIWSAIFLGDDGYVHTLYDQSGNGNDFVQTTNANQYQLISNGNMITDGGYPAMESTSRDQTLLTGSIIDLGTTYSIHAIFNMSSTDSEFLGRTSRYAFARFDAVRIYHNPVGGFTFNEATAPEQGIDLNVRVLYELYRRGDIVQMYKNGVNAGNASASELTNINSFTFESLGGESASYNFLGKIQALIVYDTDVLTGRKGTADKLMSLYGL